MNQCHVCHGYQRITVIKDFMMAISHCINDPSHDVGEPYLSLIQRERLARTSSEWAHDDPNPAADQNITEGDV